MASEIDEKVPTQHSFEGATEEVSFQGVVHRLKLHCLR
jgi:hypothetical protein